VSRFVLIPGAGGEASYWHRVVPLLEARGHQAIAVDLPGPDPAAGLPEYTEIVLAAIGDGRDHVLVAQSLGAFTAPVVCARAPVRLLVLVNAMIPIPGETPGAWFVNTGAEDARVSHARAGGYSPDFNVEEYFLHDVPAEVLAEDGPRGRPEDDIAFGQPFPIDRWPDVPTRILVAADDRFFPAGFQRRVARTRRGRDVEVIPGGHLVALSRPVELTEHLIGLLDCLPRDDSGGTAA
jgi:pimeloyl-ACP methyl ester carboxylesterase